MWNVIFGLIYLIIGIGALMGKEKKEFPLVSGFIFVILGLDRLLTQLIGSYSGSLFLVMHLLEALAILSFVVVRVARRWKKRGKTKTQDY